MPVIVAYAPIDARYFNESFGDWFWSSELHHFAGDSPLSWTLVPVGLALLFAAVHALNALARACGRWTKAWLAEDE